VGRGREPIETAVALIEGAAAAGWRGADPYDGLWVRWPRIMTGGALRRMVILQLHARSPVDIRRIYRRRHPLLAKGAALFALAGLRVHRHTGRPRPLELALDALQTLAADTSAGPAAWGYPFETQLRWGRYPAFEPSIVPTAFAIEALLEGERVAGRADLGERARAAARRLVGEHWTGDGHFAYHGRSRANIHNASLLGARAVWHALGEEAAAEVRAAVRRALGAQREDGSWPYGEGASLGWSDSFHTGYVLLCLDALRGLDPEVDEAVVRGAVFYRRFFGQRGESRLWADRAHPEDGHSAGTGLSALAALHRRGLVEREFLDLVCGRVLTHGIRGGHAVHRRYRGGVRSSVRYLRWCDGHVALGLADAAIALERRTEPVAETNPA